eukprot:768188-Pelagomonas_calceolata.AAC.1
MRWVGLSTGTSIGHQNEWAICFLYMLDHSQILKFIDIALPRAKIFTPGYKENIACICDNKERKEAQPAARPVNGQESGVSKEKQPVMIATDVAARGLDFTGHVSSTIHMPYPCRLLCRFHWLTPVYHYGRLVYLCVLFVLSVLQMVACLPCRPCQHANWRVSGWGSGSFLEACWQQNAQNHTPGGIQALCLPDLFYEQVTLLLFLQLWCVVPVPFFFDFSFLPGQGSGPVSSSMHARHVLLPMPAAGANLHEVFLKSHWNFCQN